MELEIAIQEPRGNDTAALEDKFGFGAHKEGAETEHPARRRDADVAGTPGATETAHKFPICHRAGRGNVYRPAEFWFFDEAIDGPDIVDVVDPRNVLPARSGFASESEADELQQSVKNAATLRSHHHGGSESDFAGKRRVGGKKGALPTGGDVDAEGPCVRRARLIAADFAL